MRFANGLRYSQCSDRLLRRREMVLRTRDFVAAQRDTMPCHGGESLDDLRLRRQQHLDEVYGWYDKEAKRIDAVLELLVGSRR